MCCNLCLVYKVGHVLHACACKPACSFSHFQWCSPSILAFSSQHIDSFVPFSGTPKVFKFTLNSVQVSATLVETINSPTLQAEKRARGSLVQSSMNNYQVGLKVSKNGYGYKGYQKHEVIHRIKECSTGLNSSDMRRMDRQRAGGTPSPSRQIGPAAVDDLIVDTSCS